MRCKPNELWVDNGSEFYYRSIKSWLEDNNVECIQSIMRKTLLFLRDVLEL